MNFAAQLGGKREPTRVERFLFEFQYRMLGQIFTYHLLAMIAQVLR
jgi:hypothetical protein